MSDWTEGGLTGLIYDIFNPPSQRLDKLDPVVSQAYQDIGAKVKEGDYANAALTIYNLARQIEDNSLTKSGAARAALLQAGNIWEAAEKARKKSDLDPRDELYRAQLLGQMGAEFTDNPNDPNIIKGPEGTPLQFPGASNLYYRQFKDPTVGPSFQVPPQQTPGVLSPELPEPSLQQLPEPPDQIASSDMSPQGNQQRARGAYDDLRHRPEVVQNRLGSIENGIRDIDMEIAYHRNRPAATRQEFATKQGQLRQLISRRASLEADRQEQIQFGELATSQNFLVDEANKFAQDQLSDNYFTRNFRQPERKVIAGGRQILEEAPMKDRDVEAKAYKLANDGQSWPGQSYESTVSLAGGSISSAEQTANDSLMEIAKSINKMIELAAGRDEQGNLNQGDAAVENAEKITGISSYPSGVLRRDILHPLFGAERNKTLEQFNVYEGLVFDSYRHAITGAAAGFQELAFLKERIPLLGTMTSGEQLLDRLKLWKDKIDTTMLRNLGYYEANRTVIGPILKEEYEAYLGNKMPRSWKRSPGALLSDAQRQAVEGLFQ